MAIDNGLILVTGVTGYIGGRLVPRLLEEGCRVRVMTRNRDGLGGRSWLDQVEVVEGDVLKPETLAQALTGVSVAYYLIHSLEAGAGFEERDLQAAHSFGSAAKEAGVARIIYLGGLGDENTQDLSEHLRSRHKTGDALRDSGVPITEFRAAVIVGSGSTSFEMVRYLTERLPIMIAPHWVYTRIQPIGVRDLMNYLVATLTTPESIGQTIQIGGRDVLTYADMMLGYARARSLRRYIIPVPMLTPRLSSYWVHLVTPISANVAQPLIEGLRNEVIVKDDSAKRIFPKLVPADYFTAVRLALEKINAGLVETSWADKLTSELDEDKAFDSTVREGMMVERRQKVVDAPADVVYRVVTGVGGSRGWPAYNRLWRLRGRMDRWVGGVGFRRGRRHPDDLRVGDVLDFWRVESIKHGALVRLRAEMRLPGRGWLQFELSPAENEPDKTQFVQTAFYAPKGLFGFLYWYVMMPFHGPIFTGMIDRLALQAEALAAGKEIPLRATNPRLVQAAVLLLVIIGAGLTLALTFRVLRQRD